MVVNDFDRKVLVERFGEGVIRFPDVVDRIYAHKQNLPNYTFLNSDEAIKFFNVLPLLITHNNLENILIMGAKDKLTLEEKQSVDRNLDKVEKLQFFLEDVDVLPMCYFVNDNDLNENKKFLNRAIRLNWGCETWSSSYNGPIIGNIVVDMALGGTHYLGVDSSLDEELVAYAKLTTLVDGGNNYLSIDSVESGNVDRQSIYHWKEDGMLPELFSLFEGSLTISRLLKYDGVIFKAPEAAQIAGLFGLPQRKFKDYKCGYSINYCKAGVKLVGKTKQLYRAPSFKDRFLSQNIFPFSKSGLQEKVERFNEGEISNSVQEAYLENANEILDRY